MDRASTNRDAAAAFHRCGLIHRKTNLPLTMKLEYASAERVTAFIHALSDQQLRDIYWREARLWLDTGDGELHLTFGPPEDRGAHVEMVDASAAGQWVWIGLGVDTAKEHPHEDGSLVDDWPPLVGWTRQNLTYFAEAIATDLWVKAALRSECS